VKYDISNKISVAIKYQKEMSAENRPEGEKVWAKVTMAF